MAKIIEIEMENSGRRSRHKILNTEKYYDKKIRFAGCKIEIKPGWQFFNIAGNEIKARIVREWAQ